MYLIIYIMILLVNINQKKSDYLNNQKLIKKKITINLQKNSYEIFKK